MERGIRDTFGRFSTMSTAPKDGRPLLLLTSNFGVVQGFWKADAPDLYTGEPGAWHSGVWAIADGHDDPRMFCGATPVGWAPAPDVRHCRDCDKFIYRGEGEGQCRGNDNGVHGHDRCSAFMFEGSERFLDFVKGD